MKPSGFTVNADPTRIVVARRDPDDPDEVAASLTVDFRLQTPPPLVEADTVTVPSALMDTIVGFGKYSLETPCAPTANESSSPSNRGLKSIMMGTVWCSILLLLL